MKRNIIREIKAWTYSVLLIAAMGVGIYFLLTIPNLAQVIAIGALAVLALLVVFAVRVTIFEDVE
jgi:ABC-type multidrug transport system permease subunit